MAEADFAPETLDLARDTMKGQLRDLLLDHMRDSNTLPWNLRPESEQKTIIEFVEMSVSQAIAQAVQLIARDGKRAIVAQVDQVVVKDGLKVVLKTSNTEPHLLMLGNAVGATVLITSADADEYMGGQERHPDKLQAEMFDGEDDGDEDPPVFDGTPNGGKK
jgi:hypothetical protein